VERDAGRAPSLLFSDILIRFCERIPDSFVVIWATRTVLHPVSELTFGWLSAIENITAVLVYLPVAYFADRFGKKPFVLITFAFFTVFLRPAVHAVGRTLAAAFFLRGLKEFGEPTRKALIMDLAPEGARPRCSASTTWSATCWSPSRPSAGRFCGAFAGVNLKVAFAFGVIGTLWFAWRGRDCQSSSAST
jgi:MFS family permease